MKKPSFSRSSVLALLLLALAGPVTADKIRIVTEELPPYNMTLDGQLTGMGTEVVQAVLQEIGVQASIQSMPWARAYDIALNTENVLIYSIARTAQREKLFKWVGSIAPMHWSLYAKHGSPIQLNSLDDARKYQIATVKQDAGEQYLQSKGFVIGQNLQSSNQHLHNYQKLTRGRVDLWLANKLHARYLVRQTGDELAFILRLPDLEGEYGLSMAFSPQTSDAVVERFREGLLAIRANGRYAAIAKKWL